VNVDSDTINHVSLCSGYGGIDLGLKRAIGSRLCTVAFVEIEAFAAANLAAKAEAGLLDNAPIWSDLKRFPWGKFHGLVDILSGGYPCQPFSAAGKRLGAEDPRHLWPHISAGIAAMRPAVCFFENVEGHISLGLRDVLQDLVGLGYRATWCVASASECGAPHQRKRIWILAERNDQRSSLAGLWQQSKVAVISDNAGEESAYDQSLGIQGCGAGWLQEPSAHAGQALPVRGGDAGGDQLADSPSDRLNGSLFDRETIMQAEGNATAGSCAWPSRPGEQQFAWEPPRVVDIASAGQQAQRDESNGQRREGFAGESSKLGNATHTNRRPRVSAEEAGAGPDDIWRRRSGESGEREIIKPMGLRSDGTPDGLGVAELSGLSDQELAEIRHWMVASDNRTDELRLLGK
jgi:site-specific DNA-cytosine methylase